MKLLFVFLPFFFAFALMPVFVAPGGARPRFQAAWAAWFLFCAAKFICFDVFGGDAFAPELPEVLIWAWNLAYSGMCLLLAFALAYRFARFVLSPFARLPCGGALWFVVLPLVAWSAAAKGVYNGVKPPVVREVEIVSPELPASLDGYRILHATDIHASAAARAWRTKAIVEAANAAKPDLICLTGDYFDGMCSAQSANVAPLAGLKARDGVIAVTGNHEYYYDTFAWLRFFRSIGIRFLDGECVFPRPGLAVAGVNDPACIRAGFAPPSAAGAFAAATNGEFRILLQHRPHVGAASPASRCDLQLSGHTHGGVAPLMDMLVARWNGGMTKGFYSRPHRPRIYVSSGAGQWAGFPIRFFDDPELVVFTLRKPEKAE